MKFLILSEKDIKEYVNPSEKYVLISIFGTHGHWATLPYDKNRVDVIFVEFDDIDHKRDPFILFDTSKARQILQFVMKYKDEVDSIICQCQAGISRSAGTAAALSKILNGDDMWVFKNPKYFPNTFVYHTLMAEYYLITGEGGK